MPNGIVVVFGGGYFSMVGGSRFMWKQKMVERGNKEFFLVFGFSMTGGFCHDSNAMKAPALCKRRKNALWPFVLR